MNRLAAAGSHSILGRGDLVDAVASGHPEILDAVAEQLGLVYRSPRAAPEPLQGQPAIGSTTKALPKVDSSGYPADVEDVGLWMVTHFAARGQMPELPEGPVYVDWKECPKQMPDFQQLAPWSAVGPRLRRGLSDLSRGKLLDLQKLVARIARRECIAEIPRRRRRRWGLRFQVVKDISLHLTPFQQDQAAIVARLRKLLPSSCLEVAAGTSPFALCVERQDGGYGEDEELPYQIPLPGTQVMVLGDLGCLNKSASEWMRWLRWGRKLNNHGCRLLALVPCGAEQIHASLRSVFAVETWQKPGLATLDDQRREQVAKRLLVLASPAARLEPELLRDLRGLIPEAADASLEADVWNSDLLSSNHCVAATIDFRKARKELRPRFEALPEDVRRAALACLRRWRVLAQGAPEIWFEEVLCLTPASQRLIPPQDLKDARAGFRKIASERNTEEAVEAFLSRSTDRMTDAAFIDPVIGRVLRTIRRELHPGKGVAAGTDPREIPGGPRRRYQVAVHDREILLRAGSDDSGCIYAVHSSNQHFTIEDDVATEERWFWKKGRKPDYVSNFGTDQYGAWFEFAVPFPVVGESRSVTQRMRWIRAGEFLMGSPEDEVGRYQDEGPQHRVMLTKGFWLAETPCTQDLWQAVMGENPSEFRGERLPVENVSWEDAQRFLNTLLDRIHGLELGLPTEAQWEYACRAGTETPYWFGDECDPSKVNFGRNVGQTSKVKSYAANPFGLFDVHGNVLEWCEDYWQGTYDEGPQLDPTGPEEGSDRVIRGGSWINVARNVRSAYRNGDAPGDRDFTLGFRCLSQSLAEPSEAAEGPVAEQGPERTRLGGAEKFARARAVKADPEGFVSIESVRGSRVAISTNLEEVWLSRVRKPTWAKAFGQDAFGAFADFELATDETHVQVRQRLRWIPPGKFRMGSPPDEQGRYANEVPHDVTISAGFWMFETPCTQALWLAVMGGENPSRFPDSRRPVEQVSWEEARDFSMRLSEKVPGLNFALPTEAQWEYACRAGTNTAIYSGPLEILGDANVPTLDTIAWYGGNSGHQFDHERPEDISNFSWLSDKQYEFDSAGTRRVKEKRPNAWGLYDMLGNVWEWCTDWYGEYDTDEAVDPTGPAESSSRVIRGGGWVGGARVVRSAYRSGLAPGVRGSALGFRCLSSVSQVAEQVSASSNAPRNEAGENQRAQ